MSPESGQLCCPRGQEMLMFTPIQAKVATGEGGMWLPAGERYRQDLHLGFLIMALNCDM